MGNVQRESILSLSLAMPEMDISVTGAYTLLSMPKLT
jgi:hypothetical protein